MSARSSPFASFILENPDSQQTVAQMITALISISCSIAGVASGAPLQIFLSDVYVACHVDPSVNFASSGLKACHSA